MPIHSYTLPRHRTKSLEEEKSPPQVSQPVPVPQSPPPTPLREEGGRTLPAEQPARERTVPEPPRLPQRAETADRVLPSAELRPSEPSQREAKPESPQVVTESVESRKPSEESVPAIPRVTNLKHGGWDDQYDDDIHVHIRPTHYPRGEYTVESVLEKITPFVKPGLPDKPRLAYLAGALPGADMTATAGPRNIVLDVHQPGVLSQRRIIFAGEGKEPPHLYIAHTQTASQGGGLGILLFAKQVREAVKFGMKDIQNCSARGDGYIGYKVWPKFGYNSPLSRQRIKVLEGSSLESARTIQDLYDLPGGQKYWEKRGNSFEGKFDLEPGSKSIQRLEAYLKSKSLPPLDSSEWDSMTNPVAKTPQSDEDRILSSLRRTGRIPQITYLPHQMEVEQHARNLFTQLGADRLQGATKRAWWRDVVIAVHKFRDIENRYWTYVRDTDVFNYGVEKAKKQFARWMGMVASGELSNNYENYAVEAFRHAFPEYDSVLYPRSAKYLSRYRAKAMPQNNDFGKSDMPPPPVGELDETFWIEQGDGSFRNRQTGQVIYPDEIGDPDELPRRGTKSLPDDKKNPPVQPAVVPDPQAQQQTPPAPPTPRLTAPAVPADRPGREVITPPTVEAKKPSRLTPKEIEAADKEQVYSSQPWKEPVAATDEEVKKEARRDQWLTERAREVEKEAGIGMGNRDPADYYLSRKEIEERLAGRTEQGPAKFAEWQDEEIRKRVENEKETRRLIKEAKKQSYNKKAEAARPTIQKTLQEFGLQYDDNSQITPQERRTVESYLATFTENQVGDEDALRVAKQIRDLRNLIRLPAEGEDLERLAQFMVADRFQDVGGISQVPEAIVDHELEKFRELLPTHEGQKQLAEAIAYQIKAVERDYSAQLQSLAHAERLQALLDIPGMLDWLAGQAYELHNIFAPPPDVRSVDDDGVVEKAPIENLLTLADEIAKYPYLSAVLHSNTTVDDLPKILKKHQELADRVQEQSLKSPEQSVAALNAYFRGGNSIGEPEKVLRKQMTQPYGARQFPLQPGQVSLIKSSNGEIIATGTCVGRQDTGEGWLVDMEVKLTPAGDAMLRNPKYASTPYQTPEGKRAYDAGRKWALVDWPRQLQGTDSPTVRQMIEEGNWEPGNFVTDQKGDRKPALPMTPEDKQVAADYLRMLRDKEKYGEPDLFDKGVAWGVWYGNRPDLLYNPDAVQAYEWGYTHEEERPELTEKDYIDEYEKMLEENRQLVAAGGQPRHTANSIKYNQDRAEIARIFDNPANEYFFRNGERDAKEKLPYGSRVPGVTDQPASNVRTWIDANSRELYNGVYYTLRDLPAAIAGSFAGDIRDDIANIRRTFMDQAYSRWEDYLADGNKPDPQVLNQFVQDVVKETFPPDEHPYNALAKLLDNTGNPYGVDLSTKELNELREETRRIESRTANELLVTAHDPNTGTVGPVGYSLRDLYEGRTPHVSNPHDIDLAREMLIRTRRFNEMPEFVKDVAATRGANENTIYGVALGLVQSDPAKEEQLRDWFDKMIETGIIPDSQRGASLPNILNWIAKEAAGLAPVALKTSEILYPPTAEMPGQLVQEEGETTPFTANLATETHKKLSEAFRSSLELTELTPEQKKEYGDGVDRVLSSLPAKAVERLDKGVKKVYWHKDVESVTKKWEEVSGRRSVEPIGGFITRSNGSLYIDGNKSAKSIAGINPSLGVHATYAHELGHLIDTGGAQNFVLSSSPEWKRAFDDEIVAGMQGVASLSEYARIKRKPFEGFAEFCRLLYGTDGIELGPIEYQFPKCVAFFKKHGLWPEETKDMEPEGDDFSGIDDDLRE